MWSAGAIKSCRLSCREKNRNAITSPALQNAVSSRGTDLFSTK